MANALGVVNIGGIFVVLLCGLAFAVMVRLTINDVTQLSQAQRITKLSILNSF
jgi:hypothetical protein